MKPPPRMLEVLGRCASLDDAEKELVDGFGVTKAQSWGMWDGWSGRPKSEDGLSPLGKDRQPDRVAVGEYHDGFAAGHKLRVKDGKA